MDITPPALPPTETLTLKERREECDGITTYIFHPEKPIAFEAGQYAHIRVPGLREGEKSVRELSLASAPHEPDIWFGVDGRSGSPFQKKLEALVPGDTVGLFKIRGHMTWPPPTDDIVMIGAGVGVTPFRSMLLDTQNAGLSLSSTLIHVSRGEFLYRNELEEQANEYLPVSRDGLMPVLTRVTQEHPDAQYYIAGSTEFVAAIAKDLQQLGIQRIESDEFRGLQDSE